MELLTDIEMIIVIGTALVGVIGWLYGVQNKAKSACDLSVRNARHIEAIEKEQAVIDQRLNRISEDVIHGNDLAAKNIEVIGELKVVIGQMGTDIGYIKKEINKKK